MVAVVKFELSKVFLVLIPREKCIVDSNTVTIQKHWMNAESTEKSRRYDVTLCKNFVTVVPQSKISRKLIVPWWRHMETQIWVNISPGNGLLPDDTKPLPEPMLTYRQ